MGCGYNKNCVLYPWPMTWKKIFWERWNRWTGHCRTGHWRTGHWRTWHYRTGQWRTGQWRTNVCSCHMWIIGTLAMKYSGCRSRSVAKDALRRRICHCDRFLTMSVALPPPQDSMCHSLISRNVQASPSRTADTTNVFCGGWHCCSRELLRATQRRRLLSRCYWRRWERCRSGVCQQQTTGAILHSATEVYSDATFKVVPTIYYQLFTVFVPFADAAFPVLFAIMSRKTQALYAKVFDMIRNLVPQLAPTSAMADFQEASVSAFQEVFGNVSLRLLVPLRTGVAEQRSYSVAMHSMCAEDS